MFDSSICLWVIVFGLFNKASNTDLWRIDSINKWIKVNLTTCVIICNFARLSTRYEHLLLCSISCCLSSELMKGHVHCDVLWSVYILHSCHLSVCLSVCLRVYLHVYLCIYLSVCLSVCLSIYVSIYPSICLYACLSVCLCVYLSVCLSVHLSTYQSLALCFLL